MKYQVLFSMKNNEKYLGMSSAAAVIGALRLKSKEACTCHSIFNIFINERYLRNKSLKTLNRKTFVFNFTANDLGTKVPEGKGRAKLGLSNSRLLPNIRSLTRVNGIYLEIVKPCLKKTLVKSSK